VGGCLLMIANETEGAMMVVGCVLVGMADRHERGQQEDEYEK